MASFAPMSPQPQPDRVWPTNATVPPLNDWTILTKAQLAKFKVTAAEEAAAKEAAVACAERKASHHVKHQLFAAIARVGVDLVVE